MKLKEHIEKIKNEEIDPGEFTLEALKEIKKINEEYHYFNTIDEDGALATAQAINKKGKLSGVLVSVKDCICVKDMESTAGSKILESYRPLFDATAVKKLREEGAIIIGKTAQDEFGFGSFATNMGVGFAAPLNPFDKERVCGGSSGGSAGITQKLRLPHISLAESTGGSIVAPASFCGVVGLCPTYGRVSRYGLIDYGNSLDKIGPITKTVEEAALVLEIISGYDKRDSTSADVEVEEYTKYADSNVKELKIGVLKEIMEAVDEQIRELITKRLDELKSMGAIIKEVSTPIISKYSVIDYYLIALAEASTNLAKYCGMRYGAAEPLEGGFNEYFAKVRSKYFGKEAKRRIILGTFARMAGFRDAYYIKAMKVRTRIIEEYKKAFSEFDVLVSPTMPILPPRFDEVETLSPLEIYMLDVCTSGINLAGLPHISVPAGFINGLPVGILFAADHFMERNIIRAASAVESNAALNKD